MWAPGLYCEHHAVHQGALDKYRGHEENTAPKAAEGEKSVDELGRRLPSFLLFTVRALLSSPEPHRFETQKFTKGRAVKGRAAQVLSPFLPEPGSERLHAFPVLSPKSLLQSLDLEPRHCPFGSLPATPASLITS